MLRQILIAIPEYGLLELNQEQRRECRVMNSNCIRIENREPDAADKPQPEIARRTETFYGVRYTKDELNVIWRRIYESKLMASEWIRRRMLADI
jgi:hypothetical protein